MVRPSERKVEMKELFEKAYEGSYYTIMGCGGSLDDWKCGYQKMLTDQGIGKISEWFWFTGKSMNDVYNLTGDNRYPDDLNCLMFPLDGLDIAKLIMFKLQMGDRWFDDIVDNNASREEAI